MSKRVSKGTDLKKSVKEGLENATGTLLVPFAGLNKGDKITRHISTLEGLAASNICKIDK